MINTFVQPVADDGVTPLFIDDLAATIPQNPNVPTEMITIRGNNTTTTTLTGASNSEQ